MVSAAGVFTALFLVAVVAFTLWIVRMGARNDAHTPEQLRSEPENGDG